MYPDIYAARQPDKPAIIMAGTGETVTYRELTDRSRRLAQLFYDVGLRPGDHVAVFMENNPRYFDVVWGTYRAGLYCTSINRYLQADEAAYIINDSETQVVIASAAMGEVASQLPELTPNCKVFPGDGRTDRRVLVVRGRGRPLSRRASRP